MSRDYPLRCALLFFALTFLAICQQFAKQQLLPVAGTITAGTRMHATKTAEEEDQEAEEEETEEEDERADPKVTCPKRFAIAELKCNFPISAFDAVYAQGAWTEGTFKQADVSPSYYYSAPLNLDGSTTNILGDYGPPSLPYTQDFSLVPFRRSLSGGGSNKGAATDNSIAFLRQTIASEGVTSMLDLPCGDANWQFSAWEIDSLSAYVGADVVRPVIALNSRRFCHHSNKHFIPWDLATCHGLPRLRDGPFDLVHVRDVIQHMSLKRGQRALQNVARSGARLLVATTFQSAQNVETREGDFYHANLQISPFNLPKPVRCIPTHPTIEPDLTCLWRIDETFKRALFGT